MKNCPNCHHQAKDDALFCPICGTTLDAVPAPRAEYFKKDLEAVQIPVFTPPASPQASYDHTMDFHASDVQDHKLLCMIAYLLDYFGVIIGLLMAPDSAFLRFHIRQSLKLSVLEVLVLLISMLLCWTVLVPILGLLAMIIIFVLKLSCFADVCRGKAKDAPILRIIKFFN